MQSTAEQLSLLDALPASASVAFAPATADELEDEALDKDEQFEDDSEG